MSYETMIANGGLDHGLDRLGFCAVKGGNLHRPQNSQAVHPVGSIP